MINGNGANGGYRQYIYVNTLPNDHICIFPAFPFIIIRHYYENFR